MAFVKIEKSWFNITNNTNCGYGEIILLSEINSLSNKTGSCTASNAYFANILKTDERTIQRYIARLKKNGLIKTMEKKSSNKLTVRYIYVQYKEVKHFATNREDL